MSEQRIADSHIHIRFMEYEKVSHMLDIMSDMGVTDGCLLSLPYHSTAENLAVLYNKIRYDKMTLRAFGGLHLTDRYAEIAPEIQVEKQLELGCDGFKMMYAPEFRTFFNRSISDKYYDKMFSFLEETNTPVNVHVADPEEFWNSGERYENIPVSREQMYAEVFQMLDKHPSLKVTFAHFFFLSNMKDEAVRVMEKYENVWFDLTPGVEMYWNFDKDIDFWHDFFIKYSDRIIFGTASNTIKSDRIITQLNALVKEKLINSSDEYKALIYSKEHTLKGLSLPQDVVDKICYKNYLSRMGERKEVYKNKLKDYAERIIYDIIKNPDDEYYKNGIEIVSHLKDDPMQGRAVGLCKEILNNI